MAARGDLSGVFYNPAVIAPNTKKEIFFLSENGFSGDVFGGVVYGQPLKKSVIAAGFVYYDAGKMELSWLEGGDIETKEVSAQVDNLGLVTYATNLGEKLCLGMTLKAATSRLFEKANATAVALDLGAQYLSPIKDLGISFAVQNLGSATAFVDKSNPLPLSVLLGAGYSREMGKYFMTGGIDFTYLFEDQSLTPEVGIEFGMGLVSVNAGYIFNVEEAVMHVGFTYMKESYDFAYSFVPGTYLGSTQRVSLGFRF